MNSDAPISADAIIQYAVLDALLAAAYTTGLPAPQARELGDFGIGCCDGLGGEVVLLDGDLVECTDEAPPRAMDDSETLPFFEVCRFPEMAPVDVSGTDLAALTAAIEEHLVSRNLFHAVRIDGVLAAVRVRVPRRGRTPFPSLAEATRDQVETVLEECAGTLLGFWAPAIYQGIAVAGLHLHFLSDDRLVGGHVLEASLAKGSLRVAAYRRFDLRLPTDDVFLRTPLSHDQDHRIVAMEGGAAREA
ncbi:acetolactate decarboxylase [Microbacterium sp. dk485]|uniref:acetolactate decarboxylase n=1 Tax=Microbacterium sp. dk485 TaxID=2560021 RepID=UPI0010743B32|nr:acetolactate decarboxylase [Microbacterium sp. dk485]TFV81497.1 acetolactate decarboxylase [Microbacterium sp. dk485]